MSIPLTVIGGPDAVLALCHALEACTDDPELTVGIGVGTPDTLVLVGVDRAVIALTGAQAREFVALGQAVLASMAGWHDPEAAAHFLAIVGEVADEIEHTGTRH